MVKDKWEYFNNVNIGENQVYIDKIKNKGYSIRFCYDDYKGLKDLTIEVWINDTRVGWANFSENDFEINCNNIEVNCHHQRKGIGTAIFLLARFLLGKSFYDIWEDKKSLKANIFWERKRHLFE